MPLTGPLLSTGHQNKRWSLILKMVITRKNNELWHLKLTVEENRLTEMCVCLRHISHWQFESLHLNERVRYGNLFPLLKVGSAFLSKMNKGQSPCLCFFVYFLYPH